MNNSYKNKSCGYINNNTFFDKNDYNGVKVKQSEYCHQQDEKAKTSHL